MTPTKEPIFTPEFTASCAGLFWLSLFALSLVGILVFFGPQMFFIAVVTAAILIIARLS